MANDYSISATEGGEFSTNIPASVIFPYSGTVSLGMRMNNNVRYTIAGSADFSATFVCDSYSHHYRCSHCCNSFLGWRCGLMLVAVSTGGESICRITDHSIITIIMQVTSLLIVGPRKVAHFISFHSSYCHITGHL